jgi:hypothetical protein
VQHDDVFVFDQSPSLEVPQIDSDMHHGGAGRRLGQSGCEFEDLQEAINRAYIVEMAALPPSGLRGPKVGLISPISRERGIMDELAALVQPPDLDFVLPVALLTHLVLQR